MPRIEPGLLGEKIVCYLCAMQPTHSLSFYFFKDDELGLFITELIPIKQDSELCSGLEGGTSPLQGFQVDLVLLKDTPSDISGTYTVTLVAKASHPWALGTAPIPA